MSEIDEVLGKKTTITIEDLEKLKYTEQVTQLTDSFNFSFCYYLCIGTGCIRGHENVLSSYSYS